jgi:hypothetical protein
MQNQVVTRYIITRAFQKSDHHKQATVTNNTKSVLLFHSLYKSQIQDTLALQVTRRSSLMKKIVVANLAATSL